MASHEEQQLIGLLTQSLSPATEPLARKQLDQNLKVHLPTQQPLRFTNSLATVSVNPHHPPELRLHALVLLRTIPLDPSNNKIWSTALSPEQQRQILNQLFSALLAPAEPPTPPEIINQLARVIAHLARNSPEITLQSSDEWSTLLRPILLANLLPQQQQPPLPSNPILQTALLEIFVALPWLFSSSPTELEAIVLASLSSDHFPLRLAALQAICVPDLELDTSFAHPVLQAVLLPLPSHPNQSEAEAAMTHLIEFVTFNDIPDISIWLEPLLQLTLDQNRILSIRTTALECLITLIECRPQASNLTPSLTWLTPVFRGLVGLMAEIDEDEEWSRTLDDDEEDEDAIYIQAEQALDRLTQEVTRTHCDQLFELILSAVQPPLPASWKAKHALLSVLAVTGEGLAESFSLAADQIYHVLQAGFDDPHPRVVYAAIYAIAQLSSPLKITFSTKPVHQQVLSWLLRCLENSSQPRLQAFAAKALINVLWDNGFRKVEVADEMIGPILTRLISLCDSNYNDRRSLSNKIRLDALNAIGKLVGSISRQGALAFFDTTISTLRKLMEGVDLARAASSSDGGGLDDEEVDETELRVFEVISRLAMTSGEQRFDVEGDWWAHRMVNSLELKRQAQTRILGSLAGLSGGMNAQRFVDQGCLTIIIDRVIKICHSKPDISISALLDNCHEFDDRQWESVVIGEQTFGIKSAELADKELSLRTLILLANNIGAWLIPHCDQIVGAVVPLLKFYFSDEVRESAMTLLPLLVQSAKASGMSAQQVEGASTSFCNSITLAFDAEPLDVGNLADCLLMAWAECVGYQAPSHEEVKHMTEACCERIRRVIAHGTGDDDGENEKCEEGLRRLFTGISRVLRISVGIHPEWMWSHINQRIVDWTRIVDPQPSAISIGLKRLGFRLVGAFVKFNSSAAAGPELIEKVGKNILLGFTDHDECVRGLAPFIVGLCAEKNGESPKPVYMELIKSSMDLLVTGLQANSRSIGTTGTFGEAAQVARENCVSALAKIIRNPEGLVIDVDKILPQWIDALPIEIDVEEVEPSYGLLLELIARGHESVDPTKNEIGRIEQVIQSLLSAILNDSITFESRNSLSVALNAYLSQLPPQIVELKNNGHLPPDSVWTRLDGFLALNATNST
ncbi:hypothetical protein PTTG_04330 [Puccinia triticina 1-1 BBBD Race 1]|uniref:Importin N-terminal domain-containing protein n=1 Tax=Puccinia triticina (isolate 1-1 / race 1 (BBBD)) TaxID=630390 RepID=A0A180GNB1_PUCT1|nr:hypothetical protein PTTG_04330 [Puccinia triticina 1-1 BBBD Race 1]